MNGADLVVAVRLKADGSGFVGQVRLSRQEVEGLGNASAAAGAQARVLAAGTNEAAAGARNAAAGSSQAAMAAEGMAASHRQAAAAAAALGSATRDITQDQRQFETEVARLRASLDPMGESVRRATRDLELAETAFERGAMSADELALAQKRLEAAQRGVVVSMGQQRMAGMMVGQQLQDIGIQASMGTDPLRIMAMQGGQLAFAFDQMGAKGAGGAAARFLAGGWGAAIFTAIAIGGPFLTQLLDQASATEALGERLDETAKAADSFGIAQQMLGKIVDLTTGKFKTQNLVLIESIRLQAQLNLLKAQEKIDKLTGADAKPVTEPVAGSTGMMGMPGGNIDAAVRAAAADRDQLAQLNALRSVLVQQIGNDLLAQKDPSQYASVVGRQLTLTNDQLARIAVNGKVAGRSLIDVQREMAELATTAYDKSAALQSISTLATNKVGEDLKVDKKEKKPRKPASTEARDEFGRDAADRIDAITEAFDDTPAAVRQADRAIRQLDDLIDDLGRKKPPNFEALIQSAQEAKKVVETGLIRTIADAFAKPETLADKAAEALGQLDGLLENAAGKLRDGLIDQAAFDDFKAQIGDARDAVEDGLARPFDEFMQAQDEALQIQKLTTAGREDEADALRAVLQLQKQMGPLTAAQKADILATVQALRQEQREADLLRQKQLAYLNAIGDMRSLITDTIEEGVDGLEQLPERLLASFKHFFAELVTEQVFGPALRQLEDQVKGTHGVEEASTRMSAAVDKTSASIAQLGQAAAAAAVVMKGKGWAGDVTDAEGALGLGGLFGDDYGDIVVRGDRDHSAPQQQKSAADFFGDALGKQVSSALKAVGIDDKSAEAIGKFSGKYVGAGVQGAMEGQLASSIASSLGIRQSAQGATFGGALGGVLSEIKPIAAALGPFGSLLAPGLGIVGGLLGSLFEKPKYGTALLSSATQDATLGGSSGDLRKAAGGLAEQVQSGLKQIADQLGGVLGTFDLAIGTFDGKYRVRTTTSGWDGNGPLDYKGNSGNNLVNFDDDEAGAIAFAIADAIKDGAVSGLSAAVQSALRSSTDVEEALQEALKVADLEKLLGGISGELEATFKEFDAMAAERVDLAKKYGLDLLQVEKINAEQRADLLDQTLKSRVGDLQDFLDNIRYGDLFEGTASERRTAILAELQEAQADAEAGVEGAAARMAELRRQLLDTDREAFGTAGPEYATDRSDSIAAVERVIQIETDRVNDAAGIQRQQTDAINAGNALTDETNDLLATTNGKLDQVVDLLTAGIAPDNGGIDYGDIRWTKRGPV